MLDGSEDEDVTVKLLDISVEELQAELERLAAEHHVVGATAAVWNGEAMLEAATGLLNVNTGVDVTTDSVFQVGSISKVYTATLVMQLVEDGRLALDEPIVSVFPAFKVADPQATRTITMRHLLTHTSGIDGGDYIVDFGAGDDACARFVESLATIGQVHPPGRYASYNNAGYVVAGRVIEVITGRTWHQALAENLLARAGLVDSVSLPEQVLLRRASVGHNAAADGTPVVEPRWRLPHAMAAAGSCLCTTAADLVRFGLIHVRGGQALNGARILRADSVSAMQVEQPGGVGDALRRGLAWELGERNGHRVISHGGGTLGQHSLLVVAPDLGLVVGSSTNSPGGGNLLAGIVQFVFDRTQAAGATAGGDQPPPEVTVRADVDLTGFVGLYRRTGMDVSVTADGDHLTWTPVLTGDLRGLVNDPPPIQLVAVDDLTFGVLLPGGKASPGAIHFLEPDESGRPRYVWAGHIARRVD